MNFDIFTLLYLIGFVIAIILTTNFKFRKQITKVTMYSCALLLLLLSALRALDIGYDNVLHFQYFKNISLGVLSISEFQEPGYAILSYIVSIMGGDYTTFLSVYALISIVILVKVINRYSLYPFLSIYIYYALYFFHQNMSRLRLSMSVLILLLAIEYLHKKRSKHFILTVILASSFHVSALIYLILLPLQKVNFTKKKMITYTALSIILGLTFVGPFYREIIGGLSTSIFPEQFGLDRIIDHATRRYAVREGGWFGFIYHFIQAVLVVFFYKSIKQLGKKEQIVYNTYFVGLLLYFLFFDIPILGRLSIGFTLTEIIVATYYLKCIQNKYYKLFFIVLYLLIVLVFGYKGFFHYYESFVPYSFFWK